MNDKFTELLAAWQKFRLATVHANRAEYGNGRDDLTVLTYYWGAEVDKPDTQFFRVESAIRETWLRCGMLKTVIVTDKPSDQTCRFADAFPAVEIQVEPALVPGNLYTMSADCDGKLVDRFSTTHLMIVQDDGFPLREGVDDFLDKWDYIGAPYVRDRWLPRSVACLFNLWTMNGGFSIRTRRCCELAARYWRMRYHAYGNCHAVGEDAFYTETLPRREREYRREMRLADNRSAIRFAWDSIVPHDVKKLPFGFHRASTFARFQACGWV